MATSKGSFDVGVIGVGPAGVAAACGLRRLGCRVILLGLSRNCSIEGISERTLMRLRAAGLQAAVACVQGPGKRTGMWGGKGVATSREYLIERSAFDAALLEDAVAAGVESDPAMVAAVEPSGSGWCVSTRRRSIACGAVIDARGRRARGAPLRGPRLVSVSQRFSTAGGGVLRTAIHPLADGWCWLADDGQGTRWVQVIGALSSVQANADVPLRIAGSLEAIPGQAAFLEGTATAGVPIVRAAVAKMSPAAPSPGILRIGDACIAMDPLSGHGIHEALVSARLAVTTVHTYLESANWDSVSQVMNERMRESWEKMTTNAAHFYRMQAIHLATGFWTQAASAYESLATAARLGAQGESRRELAVPFGVGG